MSRSVQLATRASKYELWHEEVTSVFYYEIRNTNKQETTLSIYRFLVDSHNIFIFTFSPALPIATKYLRALGGTLLLLQSIIFFSPINSHNWPTVTIAACCITTREPSGPCARPSPSACRLVLTSHFAVPAVKRATFGCVTRLSSTARSRYRHCYRDISTC